MSDKNTIINETFALALQSQNKRDFILAKQFYYKILKIDPNQAAALNNLGLVLQELGEYQKAIDSYTKATKTQPQNPISYNNLGNVLKELGNFEKAKKYYQKAIDIKPNIAEVHNNLGIVFKELKKYQESISCFQKAIQINSNYVIAKYNLGKVYRELGRHDEAIKYFQKINSTRSRAEFLECEYFLNGMKNYPKLLKRFIKEDPLNLRIATLSAYVSEKKEIKNIYPFCKKPLDYVFIKNIKKNLLSSGQFSKNLSLILSKTKLTWEPSSKTTKGGYHTSGNLFEIKEKEILLLRELIEKQINIYKNKYKSQKDYFITKWPSKSRIEGWHVKLVRKGYQESHIHPSGWLSGVFYLKVPNLLKKTEGSIQFTLYGYDYPSDNNLPFLSHSPKAFDIALFPSSLFHKTIPFNSEEERHVIAFDLIPK